MGSWDFELKYVASFSLLATYFNSKSQEPLHLCIYFYVKAIQSIIRLDSRLDSIVRASTMVNVIVFYFTISKNYFINYIIPFYDTPNILTFILQYNTLK